MDFFYEIFEYRFLMNAAIACVLVGVACGIVGTYIVCRRQVFLSGGITHASFGGIGMAHYFGLDPVFGALIFAVLSAVGIETFASGKDVREDSAIGILWSAGMAIGIIFISLTPGYAPNLMSFLFGNILSVTSNNILWMLVVDIIILAVFMAFYRPIMYTAFDRAYSASQNMPVRIIGYIMAALTAVTIVISIRVVGIVLLISLLTVPAVAANMMTKRMSLIMMTASALAAVNAFIGLYISYRTGIPSGASIIFTLCFTLIIVKLLTLRNSKKAA